MARTKGPRKVHRYSSEFKVKAVKLSDLAGVQVKDVAEALDIIPSCSRAGVRRHAAAGCAHRVVSRSKGASGARSRSFRASNGSWRCFRLSTNC